MSDPQTTRENVLEQGGPAKRPGHRSDWPNDRAAALPRLLPTWRAALDDTSLSARLRLLARLRRALRTERRRAIGGHWAYDIARHSHLLAAYRLEAADVARSMRVTSLAEGSDTEG